MSSSTTTDGFGNTGTRATIKRSFGPCRAWCWFPQSSEAEPEASPGDFTRRAESRPACQVEGCRNGGMPSPDMGAWRCRRWAAPCRLASDLGQSPRDSENTDAIFSLLKSGYSFSCGGELAGCAHQCQEHRSISHEHTCSEGAALTNRDAKQYQNLCVLLSCAVRIAEQRSCRLWVARAWLSWSSQSSSHAALS